jgi:hypothetical protein
MIVEKRSFISGKVHSLDLDITQEQLIRVNNRFATKELIQDIVPHLSEDDREYLITGSTPEEWVLAFGDDE